MKTATDVIAAFDGVQPTADLLGVSAQAICNIRSRGRFPPRHWPVLVRAGQARGKAWITFDVLEKMTASDVQAAAVRRRRAA